MQPLDTIVIIAEIILFAVLSILCIYLIVSVRKFTASIEKIEKAVEELEKNVEPVIENARAISGNMVQITTTVKNNITKVDSIVDTVKDAAESIVDFEQRTQKQVEYHLNDTLNFISAIINGVKAFLSKIKGSSNRLPRKQKELAHDEVSDISS
jgi:uncharacterized protein YoxC